MNSCGDDILPVAVELRFPLVKPIAQRVRGGHPWIYRSALGIAKDAPSGSVVDIVDSQNRFLARGYYDAESPIAVRVVERDSAQALDESWVLRRVASACRIRKVVAHRIESNAVRLIHGEGDFLPGLVLDWYAGTAVVRFDGRAARHFWLPFVEHIAKACTLAGFEVVRVWAREVEEGSGRGQPLMGDVPTRPVEIREGELRFAVDVVRGQKTGFFLDQRDNRRQVGLLARGAEVLNLFGYTGGFSVAAVHGGARAVTTVDISGPAIEAARENLRLNGALSDAQELVVADAFEFVKRARRKWDLVVCDPPSFAPSERVKPKALGAYLKINQGAAALVRTGGILATSSCSSHITSAEFTQVVAQATGARSARVLDMRGAGPDHPLVPAFPEGRYLKFLVLKL